MGDNQPPEVVDVLRNLMSELRCKSSLEETLELLGTLAESTKNRRKDISESSYKELVDNSSNPEKFKAICEELRGNKNPLLDPYLFLLKRINQDSNLKLFLSVHDKKLRTSSSSVGGEDSANVSNITTDDIPELHHRLAKVAEQVKEIRKEKYELHPNDSYCKDLIPWNKERPHLSRDFSTYILAPQNDPPPLELQENFIIEDLLSCFIGCGGEFIVADPPVSLMEGRSFTVSDLIDKKLRELTRKILPLAEHYSIIVRFISLNRQITCGRINEALAAAMDAILNDYTNFVVHLEREHKKGNLNLHDLRYYIQPIDNTLAKVATIAKSTFNANARGGQTLSILNEFVLSSVRATSDHDLCHFLISSSAIPYFDSVRTWIFQGIIYDPYDEFMIVSNSRLENARDTHPDDYWDKRYSIQKQNVPSFLVKVQDQIMDSGKCLNVIRECCPDGTSFMTNEESLEFSLSGNKYLDIIYRAHSFASQSLLKILHVEYEIMQQIKCVKRYLLINQGDFVLQVLDTCEQELLKPISDVVYTRLATLLEMAVRVPSTSGDNYRDNIVLCLKSQDLTYQICKILSGSTAKETACEFMEQSNENLTGLDGFCLDYECSWPVSLVFDQKVTLEYQILFRHLFYCKYIERLLSGVWIQDKSMRSKSPRQTAGYSKCFALRAKMILCVQNLEYYMMEDAIEPNWIEFIEKADKVENIDEFLKYHGLFIEKSVKDCFLTNPTVLKIFRKLLAVCKEFALFVNPQNTEDSPICENRTFSESIDEFDRRFEQYFLSLLKAQHSVGDLSEKCIDLIFRQNFNCYYSEKISMVSSLL